jgi:hypothetical protein
MVTRKPVPPNADHGLPASPPYPVTPSAPAPEDPPPFQMQDPNNALNPSDESENDGENAWRQEGLDQKHPGGPGEIPRSLRPGPPGYTQHGAQGMSRPIPSTTNPYLQKQMTGTADNKESSASAWVGFAERPAQPSEAPPPPPLPKGMRPQKCGRLLLISPDTPTPTEQFSKISVSEPTTNPWQPALDASSRKPSPQPLPSIHTQDSGNEIWSEPPPARPAPSAPEQPVLIDIEEPESPAWDEDEPSPTLPEPSAENAPENEQILEDQHAWDESQGHASRPNVSTQLQIPEPQQGEGWNLIDHEPLVGGQQSGTIEADGTVQERPGETAPELPPRRSQEAPTQPPRPALDTTDTSTSSVLSPATATARKQKKETYEIKKITWHDVTAAKNPRVSPILVQNLNGPCPLLALVNALTLSTPAGVETALVETLRSREQVSLGLLLDAVFDELMSGRRGGAAQELPDVSDLYSFLITLHTGMNVNPRFFPVALTSSPADPRNSMSHVHPAEREAATPGTFEETREMKLYSTFSIPLIHGWLPTQDSPEYAALKRSAQSYEDAQNIFFHEEVLEEKLHREGLSFQEQATLEDISTIKAFFASAATQLTPYGLETITTSLAPGAVAILFRNDHFSTLYRHPDTLQLLQLVTDMGYAGHEEVVWESLIDVNGENAEFFSGDFRLVGGAPASPVLSHVRNASSSQSNDGWTAVPIRNQNQSQHRQAPSSSSNHEPPPQSPNHEQEDHDLALALQLQEEEEERHRNEQARRRRETELSQQYIEQQGAQQGSVPVANIRGGRGGRSRGPSGPIGPQRNGPPEQRPAIPPRRNGPNVGGTSIDPEAGVDAPPPSYEQAANQAAYVPPSDHPAHPNANPRRMSAYSANTQGLGGTPVSVSPTVGRRRPTLVDEIAGRAATVRRNTTVGSQQGLSQREQEERSKDCVIM